MNMKHSENYGDRIFCQETVQEMYRLELVSKTYDFISQHQISALLTKPDLICLDIGSGSGSIAAWLSNQTNVKHVTALDRFINLLEKKLMVSEKLQIVQHDLNNSDFSGKFDIINVRFVMMHLRNREDLLKKIVTWLNPGGWLIVSDIIDLLPQEIDDPIIRKVMSTMWSELMNTLGTDRCWSHTLGSYLKTLGLNKITNEVYLPPISKDSPMAEFWYLTWRTMHNRLLGMGDLDNKTLSDAENRLLNSDIMSLSPGMLTSIGQK